MLFIAILTITPLIGCSDGRIAKELDGDGRHNIFLLSMMEKKIQQQKSLLSSMIKKAQKIMVPSSKVEIVKLMNLMKTTTHIKSII